MIGKKPTSIPYRAKRHEAYQHNQASRLEGVVKNIGIKPVRKTKKTLPKRLQVEAEKYAKEQLQDWEEA